MVEVDVAFGHLSISCFSPTIAAGGMAALRRLRKNGPKQLRRYVEETLRFI
jgi:hypothetical protein